MVITSEITLDLLRPAAPRIVYAKQGETLSRNVKINLLSNGMDWEIPDGTSFSVCYVKPDGKGGKYEQFEIGDDIIPAATASGNAVIVNLNPQALTCHGTVHCEVRMILGNALLSTFTFFIKVQASPENDIKSEDYWNLARDEKTVFVSEKIEMSPGTAVVFDVSKFLTTPHVGDAVIGSDGYVGTVTDASGSNITVTAAGEKLLAAAGATGAVIVRGTSNDGAAYTASGDDLPNVAIGSGSAGSGKGTQIVFIPDAVSTVSEPTLQINGGAVVRIALRACENQSDNDNSPSAAVDVPIGALMRGVPYTMTFCGAYWLIDSAIGSVLPCAETAEEAALMRSFAAKATSLSDDYEVVVPVVPKTGTGAKNAVGILVVTSTDDELTAAQQGGATNIPSVGKVEEMINDGTSLPEYSAADAGKVLGIGSDGIPKWEDSLLALENGYIGTVIGDVTIGGVNAAGLEWRQIESGTPMDEPYLNEWGFRCCVAECTEENHDQPVEIYKWLYRCIKEGFEVSERTLKFSGTDGAEHEYICTTDGGTHVELPDYAIDVDIAADFSEKSVRLLNIPLVQFPSLAKEELIHYLYRVQQDNPELCFPYWPSIGGGILAPNEGDDFGDGYGGYLYVSSAMPTESKKSEMLEDYLKAAEGVKDKVYYYYGISPGDTLSPQDRCKVSKIIHDYLILNNSYYDSGAPFFANTAYSVYSDGTVAVCASFTQAFNYIARMYNIEALYMSGRARGSTGIEGHAWVLLRINGDYAYGSYGGSNSDWSCIDVYWDENKDADSEIGSWDYFMNYNNLFGVTDENEIGYREIGTDNGYGGYPVIGAPTGNYPYTGRSKYLWED